MKIDGLHEQHIMIIDRSVGSFQTAAGPPAGGRRGTQTARAGPRGPAPTEPSITTSAIQRIDAFRPTPARGISSAQYLEGKSAFFSRRSNASTAAGRPGTPRARAGRVRRPTPYVAFYCFSCPYPLMVRHAKSVGSPLATVNVRTIHLIENIDSRSSPLPAACGSPPANGEFGGARDSTRRERETRRERDIRRERESAVRLPSGSERALVSEPGGARASRNSTRRERSAGPVSASPLRGRR